MIITPHKENLVKFNCDGSTGRIYVSHLPGHLELYMIHALQRLAAAVVKGVAGTWILRSRLVGCDLRT
jgi:hypothetical protein